MPWFGVGGRVGGVRGGVSVGRGGARWGAGAGPFSASGGSGGGEGSSFVVALLAIGMAVSVAIAAAIASLGMFSFVAFALIIFLTAKKDTRPHFMSAARQAICARPYRTVVLAGVAGLPVCLALQLVLPAIGVESILIVASSGLWVFGIVNIFSMLVVLAMMAASRFPRRLPVEGNC